VIHWQGFLYPNVTSILIFLCFTSSLKGCWETELGTSACIRTDSLLIHRSHSLTRIISASTTLELLVKKTKMRGKICPNKLNTRQVLFLYDFLKIKLLCLFCFQSLFFLFIFHRGERINRKLFEIYDFIRRVFFLYFRSKATHFEQSSTDPQLTVFMTPSCGEDKWCYFLIM
jgi:hypothetical protein